MSSAPPVRSAADVLMASCARAAGCAGDLVNRESGFQGRSRGFRIAAPGGPLKLLVGGANRGSVVRGMPRVHSEPE